MVVLRLVSLCCVLLYLSAPLAAQAGMLAMSRFFPLDREAEQNKSAIIIPKDDRSRGLSAEANARGSRFMRLNRNEVTVSNAFTARRAAKQNARTQSAGAAMANELMPSAPLSPKAGINILQLFDDRAIPTTNPFHR